MVAVEVSLTTPGALAVIEDLTNDAPTSTLIGAGTVLDAESARMAIDAGARFLVSPSFDRRMVATAHRYGVASIPGAATPTEIVDALNAGADLLKIFPASNLSPAWIRAVLAALPQAPLVPTGGIGLDDAHDWLDAGAVAVGIGSALTAGTPQQIADAATSLRRRLG
jgi:2-dehydro-3-deoxyphosphogluconate aldolase / (4S)-4-hydroxy-2-oxoglutarate aldolase